MEVTDKADGSLGILYRAPDGLPALATKGSFASDQANYYTKMLRNDERLLADAKRLIEDHGDQTHLFEMVGPNNRIVVQYDEDQIMLLGSVDKKTGRYISSNDHAAHWSGGAVEMMEAKTIDEAFALADRPNREGVVIRILSEDPRKQMQLKVKQEDYKRIHRIISHFSLKDARSALRESTANADDLIRAARTGDIEAIPGVTNLVTTEFENHPIVDEMLAKRRELLEEKLMPRLKVYGEAFERISALPDSAFASRDAQKAFAASIQHEDPTMRSDLFSFYRARYDGVSMKEHNVHHILRNLSQLI